MSASVRDTGTQFAGLSELERAAAMAELHMSVCDAPTVEECIQCRGVLRVIRRVIEAVAPVARAEERVRIKQLITLPLLNARRAIPDGEIRSGCHVMDGRQVRERLRQAYLAIDREAPCCDMHNRHCEPPSELCCHHCTEAAHDSFPIRHADGSRCVLDTAKEDTK